MCFDITINLRVLFRFLPTHFQIYFFQNNREKLKTKKVQKMEINTQVIDKINFVV